MRHHFLILRIPLLAGLLAGPVVAPLGRLWSESTVLPAVQSLPPASAPSSAVHRALPVARAQLVLHPRSPVGRGDSPPWSALPARTAWRIFIAQLLHSPAQRDCNPLTGSARHFPVFPTGPPSHS